MKTIPVKHKDCGIAFYINAESPNAKPHGQAKAKDAYFEDGSQPKDGDMIVCPHCNKPFDPLPSWDEVIEKDFADG